LFCHGSARRGMGEQQKPPIFCCSRFKVLQIMSQTTIHKAVDIPLTALRPYGRHLKKPMGPRQLSSLRYLIDNFGFAGVFNVAEDPGPSYVVLDGNTRLEELRARNVQSAPCIIHSALCHTIADHEALRHEFVLGFDRARKVFDERQVVEDLKTLVHQGRDLNSLVKLSGVEKLKRMLEEDKSKLAQSPSLSQQIASSSDMQSLVLYGPSSQIGKIRDYLRTLRGKLTSSEKVHNFLVQAVDNLDVEDEAFLTVFLHALIVYQEEVLGQVAAPEPALPDADH
jgi:hypothetical protein